MLQICFAFLVLLIAVDKGDIITFAFRGHFKAVQDICEIIMCQTAHRFINKENTNIKTFVHADRAGIILRKISLFLCDLFDMFFGFLSNILFVVQCFADRGNRHATNLRNVFNWCHLPPPFLRTLMWSPFSYHTLSLPPAIYHSYLLTAADTYMSIIPHHYVRHNHYTNDLAGKPGKDTPIV